MASSETNELARLRAEVQRLRARVELFEHATELMHVGVWERDLENDGGYWSRETRRFYGVEHDGPIDIGAFFAAVHPDDRTQVRENIREVLSERSGSAIPRRFRVVLPSGEVRSLEGRMESRLDDAGNPLSLVGVLLDRTDAEAAESAALAREQMSRVIVEEASDGILVADPGGHYRDVNRQACRLLGYTRDELLALTMQDLIAPDDRTAMMARLRALAPGEAIRGERRLRHKTGTYVRVELSGKVLADGRIQAIVRDVTARRAAEEALRASEQTLRELGANLPLLLWVRDVATGELLYANPAWERFTGSPPVAGATFRQLLQAIDPDDVPTMSEGSERLPEQDFDDVVRLRDTDGRVHWFRIRAFPIRDASGQAYRVVGFGEDITEQRVADRALRTSLEEKEVLLREIHHRVKNNLQIVSSLLYLQSRSAPDERGVQLFRETQDRVAAMALVHQMLYLSTDLSRIPFRRYLRDLGASLWRSYGMDPERVELVLVVEDVVVGIESAVPCGLILNELLVNSLKHAFPDGRSGAIHIELESRAPDCYRLTVSDDGIGLPPDFEVRRASSLGSKLVDSLVQQLGATLERASSGHGTRYTIDLPRQVLSAARR